MERYTDTISGEELYVYTDERGSRDYYKDEAMSILHRLDGPAVVVPGGYNVWYVDGKRHRLDGPAIEHADGYKSWFVNNKQHRLDGPAFEYTDGSKAWWVDGVFIVRHNTKGKIIERMK